MALPLSDICVVEMGTFITGPAAGMLLADLGATVIKVERPKIGDPFRAFRGGLYSPHFQSYNRNKKSVTLDTRDDADLDVFDGLIADADVFIQNFRPGVAKKLRVAPDRLREINPRLIYGSISGFGSKGPDRDRPAFDTVAQAASGFLRLLINPIHRRVVGPALADAITGFYAAYGILAALYERERTNKGRLVETSMFEAMTHFNIDDFSHYFAENMVMNPYSRPHVSQSYVLECLDGKWVALHMSSPAKFWENLASAIGRPDMLEMPIFADRDSRIENYEKVVDFLEPIFKTRSQADWSALLAQREVPHAPLATPPEVLDSEQARAIDLCISDPDGPFGAFRTIRSPVSFDGRPNLVVTAPPMLGADNAIVDRLRAGGKALVNGTGATEADGKQLPP